MADKLNEALKLILEMLRESEDNENKYYLVQAHNELMKVKVKGNEDFRIQ